MVSWGEPGTDAGQFNLVHNIACDDDSWVYVADRENHRVQVFDGNGKYQTQWNNLMRPCGLFVKRGKNPLAAIGEPDNIASTICVRGWTRTDSAASGRHGALKCHRIREFGSDRRMSAYNEDHSY